MIEYLNAAVNTLNKESEISLTNTQHLLDLIQGICLVDQKSKLEFSKKVKLNIILNFLLPTNNSVLLISALETLETILIDCSTNVRLFESLNGIEVLSKVLLSPHTVEKVKY
ncbi:hypothetical protein HDU92_005769 [Lobulomyces angularis]|nr:hypothetical protein HDU92_005769 [Lobulomyces angularis]